MEGYFRYCETHKRVCWAGLQVYQNGATVRYQISIGIAVLHKASKKYRIHFPNDKDHKWLYLYGKQFFI